MPVGLTLSVLSYCLNYRLSTRFSPNFGPFFMTKILRQRLIIQYGERGKTQVLEVRKLQNRHIKPENYEKKTSRIDNIKSDFLNS